MHIVVLAYGPSQVTTRAVNRARRLAGGGDTVTTVAAFPTPQTGNDTPTGSAGLRSVIGQLPNEPTMLIHDDVVITTRGIMALDRCLAEGSRFAIPYSNDPKTDHFVGALPTEKAAERGLDQIQAPTSSKSANEIRPASIAALRDDLLDLLAEHLIDPFSTIHSEDNGYQIAGGAVASHSSHCVSRFVDDDLDKRPLLVAALIVKDEEKMLPECLESLQQICDRIEVCDTGSSDNTIAIARSAGANVIERAWPNDFGAARNHALEQCRDARYILVVDADERLRCPDPAETRRYLATYAAEHSAFNVDVTNLTDEGDEMYNILSVRLFRGTDTEYRGALHEVVYELGSTAPMAGSYLGRIKVEHHGYTKEVVAERDKANRNLQLAEIQHAETGDARTAVHLARSLSYAGESPERALELLEQSLEELADGTPTTKAQILVLMADRCIALNNLLRGFSLAEQALDLMPSDDTAAGFLAASSEVLGNHAEFIAVAERIRDKSSPREVVRVEQNRMIFQNHLVVSYASVNRAEDAVASAFDLLADNPSGLSGWPALVECLHRNYGATAIELVAPLAVKDQGGGFLEPVIRTYPSTTTADFCALYSSMGGTVPEVIRVGLLAAAMADNEAAFHTLCRASSLLDRQVRAELADRIAATGRTKFAAKLQPKETVAL